MAQPKPDRKRVLLLATDRSHSIIGEIVDGKTNTIAYSTYGEQSAQQDVSTRMGFNGQLREGSIGWYLLGNGYRAYNPRLMRFHSPDSWSPFGRGGLNAYMYCVGDPVNRSDPTGHVAWIEPAVKRFAINTFNFFFGGADVTGPRRLTNTQATIVEKFGGMSPEKNNEGMAIINAGGMMMRKSPDLKIGNHQPQDVGNNNNNRVNWSRTIPPVVVIRPPVPKTVSPPRSVSFNKSVTLHDGPTNPAPTIEHNQLQGGEVHPRQNHWPSNESLASNGSSWTNASNLTAASSIHSGRFSHASSLRSLNEAWERINQLERDQRWSSSESFHSAVSSIRDP